MGAGIFARALETRAALGLRVDGSRARRDVQAVLDLGTGGGEVISRVVGGLGCTTIATEEWHVNAPVAAERLRGRANVVRASAEALPFQDDSFDLVLSRHEAIAPAEIARVLGPTGHFLTQQVIPDLWHELRAVFPDMTVFPDHYSEYRAGLRAEGLTIEYADEFRQPVEFRKLGHLVYHLVAAPWSIPNFDVRSHLQGLDVLQRRIDAGHPLILTDGYYVIHARASQPEGAIHALAHRPHD